MKRGTLHIDWIHNAECMAGKISILNDTKAWLDRHRVCECGMPSNLEFDSMQENESIAWAGRVDRDETDRQFDPNCAPEPGE